MSKKNVLQNITEFTSTKKGMRTALCTAGAATLAGFLTARLVKSSRQETETQNEPTKADLARIHMSLLRTISQNLYTPLSDITGNSLLYLENHKNLEETENLELIKRIHEDSGWLANMVGNLLAVTHLEDMGESITVKDEMVEEVLGETLQKMEKRHPGLEVHVLIPDDPVMVPMDALLIEQVLLNLLDNSLLHSGSEGPVDIIVEDGAKQVTFTVRDYGHGIPEEKLKDLWVDFSAPESLPDTLERHGVGLAICKTILDAHHGTLSGRNHGGGAEFGFTLPKRRP